MITMIARMTVLPENAPTYEKLLSYVRDMSLQHEPGVSYYAWAKSADEANRYVVIEVYENEQAHAAHMASEWVKNSIPVSISLIEGKLEIEQYVSPGQAPVILKHG